ncbi:DUF1264-domain-containing protein [Auriscalpium vulgare]|uniref:DUF1264-domain-containing protein n=1 Tax=Auriscalpium vulgare TaxID=40419 RepID=A0ACB8RRH7_9AGAM|nr:DUF1264-domain-containing protein [Auriscalpium vulgare]
MEPETKQSAYHSSAYHAAGEAMMSFKPINAIHQHLCGIHTYAHDSTRHVSAHHYCTHLSPDLHQCVIYDSDEPNARLIGIEYIVSEKIFHGLPSDEKKYWHSHKYEVESGVLQLIVKGAVPGVATDAAEQPAMLELHKTYGKTIHTWAIDQTPELPLGPPNLMMAYLEQGDIDQKLLSERDAVYGISTEAKRELRKTYLPDYTPAGGADQWAKRRKGVKFTPEEVALKK